MNIILASTSPFRQAVLKNLRLPFSTQAPNIDEHRRPGESAAEMVKRLAVAKASAVSADDKSFVIGSDQVAVYGDEILGKPLTAANAVKQLSLFSGQRVMFLTGLCVRRGDEYHHCVEPFEVVFRRLSAAEIATYVALEQPLQCAGAFKSEGLGIHLFTALNGRDPNALIGLPVIALGELFRQYGVSLLTETQNFAQGK